MAAVREPLSGDSPGKIRFEVGDEEGGEVEDLVLDRDRCIQAPPFVLQWLKHTAEASRWESDGPEGALAASVQDSMKRQEQGEAPWHYWCTHQHWGEWTDLKLMHDGGGTRTRTYPCCSLQPAPRTLASET